MIVTARTTRTTPAGPRFFPIGSAAATGRVGKNREDASIVFPTDH